MKPWTPHHTTYLDDNHVHRRGACALSTLEIEHDSCFSNICLSFSNDSNQDACIKENCSKQQKIIIKSIKGIEKHKTKLKYIECTLFTHITGPAPPFYNEISSNLCSHHKIPLLDWMNILLTTKHYDIIQRNDEILIQKLVTKFFHFPYDQICSHCLIEFILDNDGKDFFRFLSANPLKQNVAKYFQQSTNKNLLYICDCEQCESMIASGARSILLNLKWIHLLQYICCLIIRNKTSLKYILKNTKLFIIFYNFLMNLTKYLLNHRKSLIQFDDKNQYIALNICVGPYSFKIIGSSLVSWIYSYGLIDVIWIDIIRYSIPFMQNKHIKLLIFRLNIHQIILNYVLRKYLFELSSNMKMTEDKIIDEYSASSKSRTYSIISAYISSFICGKYIKYRMNKQSAEYLKWKRVELDIVRSMNLMKQTGYFWNNNTYIHQMTYEWNIDNDISKYNIINLMNESHETTSWLQNKLQRTECCNPLCNRSEENEKFKMCSSCKCVWYCSKRCQKLHWNRYKHNVHCKVIYLS